ncbi:MAG: DUF4388 domain-containing protein [Spirulinaceae cyanobacterium]
MAITGYLSEFSLAELFQFLDGGNKTGLLTIRAQPNLESGVIQSHYVWFRQGRIMGAANRLDGQGLLASIHKRGWLSKDVAAQLSQNLSADAPLGLQLKSQGILQPEQLKILFSVQVLRQVCALFTYPNGSFEFNNQAPLPWAEMTGLSTPATEVTLAGLRALKDWSNLQNKLPESTSALFNQVEGKPKVRLNQQEWQVWEFTDGATSLKKVSQQLKLSIAQVQQISFRLIVVGLVEELPLLSLENTIQNSQAEVMPSGVAKTESSQDISESFLNNLVGFLRNKV